MQNQLKRNKLTVVDPILYVEAEFEGGTYVWFYFGDSIREISTYIILPSHYFALILWKFPMIVFNCMSEQ